MMTEWATKGMHENRDTVTQGQSALDTTTGGGRRAAWSRGTCHRSPAQLHEHLASASDAASHGHSAGRIRRGDPAHRRLHHLLWHGGAAPVRDDGRVPAQLIVDALACTLFVVF